MKIPEILVSYGFQFFLRSPILSRLEYNIGEANLTLYRIGGLQLRSEIGTVPLPVSPFMGNKFPICVFPLRSEDAEFPNSHFFLMKNPEGLLRPIYSLSDALNRCQTLGMRVSRQRRFILELLWQAKEHLSAREIYDRLNQQGKNIGHTSVYQNLEALSSQGIIECVERCDGRLYGHISDSHSHINCLDTQQIIDIHIELPPDLLATIEAQTGVKITDYRIDFFGYKEPLPTLPNKAFNLR